jgi:hypothetical protein
MGPQPDIPAPVFEQDNRKSAEAEEEARMLAQLRQMGSKKDEKAEEQP